MTAQELYDLIVREADTKLKQGQNRLASTVLLQEFRDFLANVEPLVKKEPADGG